MISLEEIARAHAIPIVFVLKTIDGEPNSTAYEAAKRRAFHVVTIGPYFAGYARDRGLQAHREEWADTFWLSRRNPHPNELGHRLVAEAILQTVTPLVAAQPSVSGGPPGTP